MKKKVLTLGLAMSLVAAPYALAEQGEDADLEAKVLISEAAEDETTAPTEPVAEETNADAGAPVETTEEEGATEEDATETEEDATEAEETDEATKEEAVEETTEEGATEEVAEEEATEEEATEEAAVELADLNQSWAQGEIQFLVEAEIISGFPDGTFQPAANMTRDQFAKVLALSLGLEVNEVANPFTDAGWAAPYIGALVDNELTQGLTESLYGSKDNVTREQLAVFFVRALGFEEEVKNLEVEELDFADSDQIASYAEASVAFLTAIDFIKGIEKDGAFYFNPKGNADRQAVARLAYELVVNGAEYKEKGQALLDSLATEEEVTEEKAVDEQVTEEEGGEVTETEASDSEEGTTEEATDSDEESEEEAAAEEEATDEVENNAATDEETDDETVEEIQE